MTSDEVTDLCPGDEVFWNDPDAGLCSRHLVIHDISLYGDVVRITDRDGSFLECYADELE